MSFFSEIFQRFGANTQDDKELTPLQKFDISHCSNDLVKDVLSCALDIHLERWTKVEKDKDFSSFISRSDSSIYARSPKGKSIRIDRTIYTQQQQENYDLYVGKDRVGGYSFYGEHTIHDESPWSRNPFRVVEKHVSGEGEIAALFNIVCNMMSNVEQAKRNKESAKKETKAQKATQKQKTERQIREESLKRKIKGKL